MMATGAGPPELQFRLHIYTLPSATSAAPERLRQVGDQILMVLQAH